MLIPILVWILAYVVLVGAIWFVPPSWKLLRIAMFGLACAASYYVAVTPAALSENCAFEILFKGAVYGSLLRAFALLFVRNPAMPPERSLANEKMGIWPKWTSPFHMLSNGREIGNPYVIKRVPPFSNSDKAYVPSRGMFLLRKIITFSISYLALELFSIPSKPGNLEMFSETKEHLFGRLHEISYEEAMVRAIATIAFYVNAVLVLSAIYDFFSIVFVGLWLTSPSYWPPPFSSFLEAYTIRQFWGYSWHQWLRKQLEENSNFISSSILRIPNGTLLARYTKIVLAFGISGLLHYLTAITTGLPPSHTGDLTYFLMQALGIMCEDAVQALYRRNTSGKPGSWTRIVGYIWVSLFLIWTTPQWMYPRARAIVPGKDDMPPWKIFTAAYT